MYAVWCEAIPIWYRYMGDFNNVSVHTYLLLMFACLVHACMTLQKKSTAAQSCSHGAVRLVGGRSSNEGTVEICINGVWGTACHSSWDNYDATVVCRQLGFSGSGTNFALCKYSLPPIDSIILNFFFRGNSTLWLSAQLWTRGWPSISIWCGMFWDRIFSSELQSWRN